MEIEFFEIQSFCSTVLNVVSVEDEFRKHHCRHAEQLRLKQITGQYVWTKTYIVFGHNMI